MSKCQAVCFLLSLSSTAAGWEQPKDKAEEVARGSAASAGSGCPRGAPGLGEKAPGEALGEWPSRQGLQGRVSCCSLCCSNQFPLQRPYLGHYMKLISTSLAAGV